MSTLVLIGFLLTQIPQQKSQPQTGSTATSAAEAEYLALVASYLGTANRQGMNGAKAMAGATDGSSTLSEIQATITRALRVEDAGYRGDFVSKVKVEPPRLASFTADVKETHRLFQSAMKEYLAYFADQNPAHIESASRTFKLCVTLMNKSIAAGTAKMKTAQRK